MLASYWRFQEGWFLQVGWTRALRVSLSRVDTALKQLGQIREYERRLKGLEKEVRTRAWQSGRGRDGTA